MTTVQMSGQDISLIAGEDLSADQFKFVKGGTADFRVILVTSATASSPIGVLQDDPATAGLPCTVRVSGVAKVLAGGTVTRFTTVTLMSTGAVQDKNGSDIIVGVALESGASGDFVTVRLALNDP